MAVPSAVACFLSTPYWEVAFVTGFNYQPYVSIGDTFRIMFGDSWQYVWPVVVISIFQILASSIVMSAIDRHFRTGRLSLRSPGRLLNYSIFAITVGVIAMCIVSIIERFVLFGITILLQTIFMAAGVSVSAALSVISIVAVLMFVLHVLIITPILYWAPAMFVYGYRFRDAAAASIKLISGKKLFSGIVIPLIPCVGIQLLVGFLNSPDWALCLTGFFLFLFTNLYITVYVILSFYHISDLARRDVVSYEFSIPQSVRDVSIKPIKGVEASEKPKKSADKKPKKREADDEGGGDVV